jgi:PKD repeat protein
MTAVNDAPVVSDIPDQTISEGGTFATINLDDYVSDVDNADSEMVWTYSGNVELSVDITNRVATITTPGVDWNGSEVITFRATDPGSLYDEDAAAFTVTAINDAPVLDSIGSKSVVEGEILEFRVHAADVDGDSVTLDALNLPVNVSFVDSGNGAGSLVFAPDFTQAGPYTVTFIASDGSLADSEAVQITVVEFGNHAPELDSIGPQSVVEGSALEFRIHATDIDADLIVLDAEGVPVNASFVDSGNGAGSFSFAPDFTQSGLYPVTFIASDGSLADSEVVAITVTEFGNNAPELDSIGAQAVDEGNTLEFRIHAVDLDADSIILSALDVPANVTFVDSGNGAGSFVFSPDYTQSGAYPVTFIASDGSLADSEAVEITVDHVNLAPVLNPIGPRTTIEGGHLAFLITASDFDGDPLVLSADSLPANASFTDSGNGTGRFVFDPDYTQSGFHDVVFKVSDAALSDSEVVRITVLEAGNQPPVLDSIGSRTLNETDTLRVRIHGTDPDGDTPALFVRNNPANSSFVDSGNGAGSFTFTPTYDQAGVYQVTFAATDGALLDSEVVEITVDNVNRPPELDSIGSQAVAEGGTLQFRIHASDPDLDLIVLSASGVPANSIFADSGNGAGSFTFNPDYTQAGTYSVTFVAIDTLGGMDDEVVQITVTEFGNNAPELDSIGPQAVDEGDTLKLRIHAVDADEDPLALDTLNVPLNATFVDSGNGAGLFVFAPDFTQSGVYDVTFIASDGSLADSELVQITVNQINLPPELDSIGPQTVVEGGTLELRIYASDPDLDSIILDALDVPANAVFVDSGNGAGSLVFTPDFTQEGIYGVTFIASDASLADTQMVQITVAEFGNNAPELDSIGPQTVIEGDILEFGVHATDIDADSIIFSALDVPENGSFVDSGNGGGSLLFAPDFTQSGTYAVTFIASDGSLADSEVVEITVTEFGNNAPELDSIGPQTVIEGQTLELGIRATDLDADSIILSALDVPPNASLVDSGNGAGSFVFDPDFTQSGIYTVTFIASDGLLADSQAVGVTVTEFGNHAPELDSIGPQSVVEGNTLQFRVHAVDIDADSIILSAPDVPVNASFVDSGNGAGSFFFAADFDQSGIHTVTFIAGDGSLADSEVVEITVTEYGNIAPVLDSIGPQTVTEGQTLEFGMHATDIDGDSIILSALDVPPNATLIDSGNGAGSFLFMPDFTQSRLYTVTFIASDGSLADSQVVEITVTEFGNHAPELDSIGPQAVIEGGTLELRLHALDVDADPIILDTLNVPINVVFVDSGDGAGSFIFTPDFTQAGIYSVTFIASDGSLADSETVEITVTEFGNNPPELDSIGPQTVLEGSTLEFRIHAIDLDADSIILDTADVPLNATFIDSGNGAGSFAFTPGFTQAGVYYVTFIASDGSLADSQVVEMTVTEFGNNPPELDSIGAHTVVEGETLDFRIHATDLDADPIMLDTLGVPLNATFVDSGNGAGSFIFTPDFTQAGIYSVTFIASDGFLADSQAVEITVTEFGNHPPELDSIGSRSVAEMDTLRFRISAVDIDADSIILDTLNIPLNAAFVDSGNGAGSFVFVPDTGQAGTYYVTFIASDVLLAADSEVVEITVTEWSNRPPVLDSIGPQAVSENDSLILVVSASDPDGAIPMLSVSELPANATFVDSGNGRGLFRFRPDFYQAGAETVTFNAIDISMTPNLSDFENVVITIVDVNQAPVIDSIGPRTVQAGDTLEIRVVGTDPTDPDGGPLHLTAVGLPENATFVDSGGGIGGFVFMPDYSQAGVDSVTLYCTDEGTPALAGYEMVEITVTEGANRPPVLDPIGYKMVNEGSSLQFRVHATDPDGSTPQLYTSQPLPDNAAFVDSGNGAGSFTFAPDYTQSGIYEITFYATDGDLEDNEQVLVQVVEAGNQAPVMDPIGPQSLVEGDTLIFLVNAIDPDGNIPELTVDSLPIGAFFTDSATGTGLFEFYPSYLQSGVYFVIFMASDGEATDSEVVEITVTEAGNQPPVLDSIGPQSVQERIILQFAVTSSDLDSTGTILRATDLPPSASFTDNGNGTGLFYYRPTFEEQGVYSTLFEAIDSADTLLRNWELVEITVIDSNRYPDATWEPDSAAYHFYEGVTRTLRVIGTDPDGSVPSLHLTSVPDHATFVDSGNGVGLFTFTPGYDQGGYPGPVQYLVNTFVVDEFYPDTFWEESAKSLLVHDLPEPPDILPINDTTIVEGNTLDIHVVTTSTVDIPSLQASGLPTNSSFVDSGNGKGWFHFESDFTQGGFAYDVRFISTSRGLADTEYVNIAVLEYGNHAPALDSIGPRTVGEEQTLSLRVHAWDIDGDSIILSAQNLPANASLFDSGNGAGSFVFHPDWTQSGVYDVTFYARDVYAAVDSEVVEITVTNVDQTPVLDPIGAKTVAEGETLQFRVHATDVDSDSLVLIASPLPARATFVDSGNGAGSFTFTPNYYQAGTYSVFFSVSDLNTSDIEMVPITVTNVPQPPQIDPMLPQIVMEGDTLEFRIHATDPDGDAFTFSVENNPPNSSLVDSGNGAGSFWFAPSYVQAGGYLVTFKATDTTGRVDSLMLTIDVTEAGNQPPILVALPDTVVPVAEDIFTLHVYAADPDEDSVILSADGLPWNAEFVDSGNGGGAFTFVPDTTQNDSVYLVTFIASDAVLADSQDVVVQVIWYLPGDANGDWIVSPPDVIYLLNYLFRNGAPPDPLIAGDCNGDGLVSPEDIIALLNYLFREGPPPEGAP